ncbi:unnamed protein product [Fusarium equiseti]|uniref:Uncharacterized protein n=1 Tax=Fusarium equiseti TaxID=61235 RepID=A0A8J2J3D9_FUSEQ|nr:unnamed protein product [Fusarium equiseti]
MPNRWPKLLHSFNKHFEVNSGPDLEDGHSGFEAPVEKLKILIFWAILSYYEMAGSIQERMFVDIGDRGQLIGVDIVLSGKLNTPILGQPDSTELIQPGVPVIDLTWQVEGKLGTWISRKKESDYEDLVFLFQKYEDATSEWTENLPKKWRQEFYEVFEADVKAQALRKNMKRALSLV